MIELMTVENPQHVRLIFCLVDSASQHPINNLGIVASRYGIVAQG